MTNTKLVIVPEEATEQRESVAKALHDWEGEPFTWPEHDNDDGYRGDRSYVRLTPLDLRARYREMADYIIAAVIAASPYRSVDVRALIEALEDLQDDFCSRHCTNLDDDHFEECEAARAALATLPPDLRRKNQ